MGIDTAGFWTRLLEVYPGKNAPEIAKETGRTKQTVYRWRDGEMPGLDVLTPISESRGVSLHWLVTGKGPQSVAPTPMTGEGSKMLSEENGSSNPHVRMDSPESSKGSEERERVRDAQMQLIIEQNHRIIQLLERMVDKE